MNTQINTKVTSWKSLSLYVLFAFILLSFLQSLYYPINFITEAIYLLQPFDTKGLIKGGIYLSIYSVGLLSVILAVLTRNTLIASILILFFCICYGVDIFIQLIGSNEQGISLGLLTLAMVEQSRADDIWLFKTQILQAVGVACALIITVIVIRKYLIKNFRVNSFISILSILLMVALSYGVVIKVFSIVGQSFPAPIKTLSLGLEYFLEDRNVKARILPENITPNKAAEYKTIVWVIDESVGGQFLSVNGYHENTTPFLKKIEEEKNSNVFNYGVIPSISNCSASANLFLRIGLTNAYPVSDYKKLKQTLPTIFQYAKRAGYKTTLIDAQVAKGQLQNQLSVNDKLDIDDFITFNRIIIPKRRDPETAKVLNKILDSKDNEPQFIVVIKWGSHWPYPQNYSTEYFKPAAKHSYTEMTEANKELIFNAYYNSIKWSVDDFLEDITVDRELDNKIIFYTSDHGQSLYQNDDPLTHCHNSAKEAPPVDEYKVPLLVFSKNIRNKISYPKENAIAQEQLFATTLNIMGYPETVVQKYGPTFAEGMLKEDIRVNVGNTDRRVEYKP